MNNRTFARKLVLAALLGPWAVASAPATAAEVSINNFAFDPQTVVVSPGQTVTWVNDAAVPHTSTARRGRWDSGAIRPGQTFRRTFRRAGTYAYVCSIHPSMKGRVVVRGR